MRCPDCGARAGVRDSRMRHTQNKKYRKYRCPDCLQQFATYETISHIIGRPDERVDRKGAVQPGRGARALRSDDV